MTSTAISVCCFCILWRWKRKWEWNWGFNQLCYSKLNYETLLFHVLFVYFLLGCITNFSPCVLAAACISFPPFFLLVLKNHSYYNEICCSYPLNMGWMMSDAILLALTSCHSHDFCSAHKRTSCSQRRKLAPNFVCSYSWRWSPTTMPNAPRHPHSCSVCVADPECQLMHWPLNPCFCGAQRGEGWRRRTECWNKPPYSSEWGGKNEKKKKGFSCSRVIRDVAGESSPLLSQGVNQFPPPVGVTECVVHPLGMKFALVRPGS